MTSLGKVWSKLRFLAGRGWARHLFAAAEGRGEIKLNYPACVAQAYPLEFPAAQRSTETVLQATKGVDTSLLARHSPGLRDFDWPAYLNCSLVRVAQTAAAIRRHCGPTVRVLDFGSYFGNFTLALRELGHRVDAIDSYRTYEPALATVVAGLQASGAQVYDFASVGYGLETMPSESYDAVLAMGVLEHVPHTPRLLLETLNRVLKPGGILVMDTPNLAYAYRRQQLARGETIFCPIALSISPRCLSRVTIVNTRWTRFAGWCSSFSTRTLLSIRTTTASTCTKRCEDAHARITCWGRWIPVSAKSSCRSVANPLDSPAPRKRGRCFQSGISPGLPQT